MASDIRLRLDLDTSQAERVTADLARRIDSSIGLAAQRMETRLGRLFNVADRRLGRMIDGRPSATPPLPTSQQLAAAGMPPAAVSQMASHEAQRAQRRLGQLGLLDSPAALQKLEESLQRIGGQAARALPPLRSLAAEIRQLRTGMAIPGAAAVAQAAGAGQGHPRAAVGAQGLAALSAAEAESRTRAFERLGRTAELAGSRTRRSWLGAGAALVGLDGQVGRVRLGIVRLAATLYSFEAIGRVLRYAMVDPIVASGRALLQAREEALRFQFALSGITGLPRAKLIDLELRRAVRDLPFPLADVRQSALAYSSVPGLASQMAAASPQQAAAAALQFGTTARRLATLDPAQGNQGAIVALREIAEGGGADAFRSIRRIPLPRCCNPGSLLQMPIWIESVAWRG